MRAGVDRGLSESVYFHIRSNIVGYVALFLVLSGGVAWATHPGGADTISTGDIINGEVRAADVGNNAVNTLEIADDAVRTQEILDGEVKSADIRNSEVRSADVLDNSLTGTDVDEPSLDLSLGTGDFSSSIPAARVTHSSHQSTPTSSPTVLSFDTERYDTADMHSTTSDNSRLTAPVDGIYVVTAQIEWDTDPDGARAVSLKKGGSTYIASEQIAPLSNTLTVHEVSTEAALAAGDYVEVEAFQDSGGNLLAAKADEFSPEFSMTWLAPGP